MEPADTSSARRVWITPYGHTYHGEDCWFLIRYGADARREHQLMPIAEAKANKLRPCPRCEKKGKFR